MAKNKKDGFIMQAGILAAAGLICRIIGILYRSPLTGIIGDEGNGYYSSAYNIYTIILLVSSYSIPSAISKVIAQRLALREYKNAQRIFRCSLLYVIAVGGIASLFTFLGAGFLVGTNSMQVLRIFAPTIFLSGLLGVLRGYFQAHRTMLPTSVSQIAEQILNAVVSILAAWLLIRLVIDQDSTTRAIYGAMGSAMGTGTGVLIALIFMFATYMMNRGVIQKRVKRDRTPKKELLTSGEIYRIIIFMVTPVILSTFIYNFSTSLNQTIYTGIMEHVKGGAESEFMTMYGIFAGKAIVISNIPIAMASAMSAAMIPSISGSFAKNNIRDTNRKIANAIKITMLISIPSATGLGVLARPVVWLLFPQKDSADMAAALLAFLSITIIFSALSTLTNAVLQGIGRVNIPIVNAAVALLVQTAVLVPLLLFTELNLYSLVIATVIYSFLMCILNGISVRKCLGYKQEVLTTFVLPLWSAAVMGLVAYGVYRGMVLLSKSSNLSLILAIATAIPVYLILVIRLGAVSREELKGMPKGQVWIRLAVRLHLLNDNKKYK